jgi:hypothetical protein
MLKDRRKLEGQTFVKRKGFCIRSRLARARSFSEYSMFLSLSSTYL